MAEEMKENIKRRSTWVRGLYILLLTILYSIAEVVMAATVLLQFGFLLITGEKNQRLLKFGAELSSYIYAVFLFLSFNSDDKPFPFTEWPATPPGAAKAAPKKRAAASRSSKKPAATPKSDQAPGAEGTTQIDEG